ncbi:hypothetical protein MMC22_003776 [Lobaria immixta]|nr:hypothetical protein [Lobaria immixta]
MAPSAGLLSLLADHTTPSFLLEVAGEYLESVQAEISECELGMKDGLRVDRTKNNNDGEERNGNVSSNEHDDGDKMNKELDEGALQQTRREGSEWSRPKKKNVDELARLRKERDVMVQDIQWLQGLHPRTPSPSISSPSSSQNPPSTSTPTHKPSSLSANSTLTPPSSVSLRHKAKLESRNSNSSISSSPNIITTNRHQHARRASGNGTWSQRSKVRGRERVRRPRSSGDEAMMTTASLAERGGFGLGRAAGGDVVTARGEE